MLSLNSQTDNITTFIEIENIYNVDSRTFINIVEDAIQHYYFLTKHERIIDVYDELLEEYCGATSYISYFINNYSLGLNCVYNICKVHTSSGLLLNYLFTIPPSSILIIHIQEEVIILKNKFCI